MKYNNKLLWGAVLKIDNVGMPVIIINIESITNADIKCLYLLLLSGNKEYIIENIKLPIADDDCIKPYCSELKPS